MKIKLNNTPKVGEVWVDNESGEEVKIANIDTIGLHLITPGCTWTGFKGSVYDFIEHYTKRPTYGRDLEEIKPGMVFEDNETGGKYIVTSVNAVQNYDQFDLLCEDGTTFEQIKFKYMYNHIYHGEAVLPDGTPFDKIELEVR